MQLIHKDEIIELERDASALNVILEKVSELIKQKDTVFSHLTIDGVDVYENHEAYINERLNDMMKIEIITRSTKEMIWETMESVHDYLQRAIPALQQLVDTSYERFTSETWDSLGQLSDGMQWMLQFKEFTQAAPEQPGNWEEFVKEFEKCEQHFAQLLEAIEMQDTVLISDILAYEITPAYESLNESIEKSLQNKEFLKHVN